MIVIVIIIGFSCEQTQLPRPMAFVVPIKIVQCPFREYGALVKFWAGDPIHVGCWFKSPTVLFRFLKARRLKRKITFVRFLQDALRYVCVMAGT
jgi:hypothetical protein